MINQIVVWFVLSMLCLVVGVVLAVRLPGEQWQTFVVGWFCCFGFSRAMVEAWKKTKAPYCEGAFVSRGFARAALWLLVVARANR